MGGVLRAWTQYPPGPGLPSSLLYPLWKLLRRHLKALFEMVMDGYELWLHGIDSALAASPH